MNRLLSCIFFLPFLSGCMAYEVPDPPVCHPANPTIGSTQPQLSSILEIKNTDFPEEVDSPWTQP